MTWHGMQVQDDTQHESARDRVLTCLCPHARRTVRSLSSENGAGVPALFMLSSVTSVPAAASPGPKYHVPCRTYELGAVARMAQLFAPADKSVNGVTRAAMIMTVMNK